MKIRKRDFSHLMLIILLPALISQPGSAQTNEGQQKAVTVPFILDHNRMLVEAEFQRKDGTWRKALLWVDTGNPDFFISQSFASDL
jgi:hypothetical protein